VLLTSVGAWNEVRHVQGASIDACLVKPVRQTQLLNTLVTLWSKRLGKTPGNAGPAPDRTRDMKSGEAGLFTGRGLRVLIAEDNIVNQRVAVRMLQRLGLEADVVSNGREAVERHELRPYDLIVMDCQMPEMDGYAATKLIRRGENPDRRVTIIAMTAEAMMGSREQCLEAGMDDYVVKPVKLGDLTEALRRWVGRI
jgi:CheY-like chemotaxis protein